MKKFLAFTLAEVLITIGVIGIVAAVTIPNLIIIHKKKVTAAQVKVAYSIVSQLLDNTVRKKGEISGWIDLSEQEIMDNYFAPQLEGAMKAETNLAKYPMRTLSSQAGGENSRYIDWTWNLKTTPLYILSNGMYLVFAKANDGYPTFIVDINGEGKPNIMGIDGFAFWIDTTTNRVTTAGSKCTNEQIYMKLKGCNSRFSDLRVCARDNTWQYYRGGYCSTVIIREGKISDDYPWGNGGITKK